MKHIEFYNSFDSSIILSIEPQLDFFELEKGDIVTLEGFTRMPEFLDMRLGLEGGQVILTFYCDMEIVVKRDGEIVSPMDPQP